jgi:Flp pilus assembly protein TadD
MPSTDAPAALFDRGNACLEHGDPRAAILAFTDCLKGAPDHPATLFNLANAQRQAGDLFDGARTLLRCVRVAPDFIAARVNLAYALLDMGAPDQSAAMAETAVRLRPESVEALLCRAFFHHHLGEHKAAAATYRMALRLAPGHAGAHSSLGNTLHAMNRMDEALNAHDAALAIAPENPMVRFNRAITLLARGDFAAGWPEYEWRNRRPGHKPRFAAPAWNGEPIEGQTILLHTEQGLGDTLQFVRYASLVAARGARVMLMVQKPLVRLLRGLGGVAAVIAPGEDLPPWDWHCPLPSLPRAFGVQLPDLPGPIPYITADPARATRWRKRLGDGNFLVGLAWAGAPHHENAEAHLMDLRRSLPPAALASLAGVRGVRFVSLQKDRAPPDIPGLTMLDPMSGMADFADTAALVAALDLVISADTSVAHLAGGMGCPVWLLSRYDGCWRWMQDRDDTPWYPTMQIYRQSRAHDWETPLQKVRENLAAISRDYSVGSGVSKSSGSESTREVCTALMP